MPAAAICNPTCRLLAELQGQPGVPVAHDAHEQSQQPGQTPASQALEQQSAAAANKQPNQAETQPAAAVLPPEQIHKAVLQQANRLQGLSATT